MKSFLRSHFRFTRRCAFVALMVLVALVAGIHFVELQRARSAWAQYREQATSRGVKFSLGDWLLDSNVPEAENFAALPLINAGVRARRGEGPLPQDLDLPTPFGSLVGNGQPIDLARVRQVVVAAGWTPDDPASSDAAVAARGLAHFDPALAQLREGLRRPYARYARDLKHPETTTVPPFVLFRKAAHVLHLRFEAHAAVNLDAACEDFELALGLACTLDESPQLVSGMIKVALTSLALDNLRHWLHRAPWTSDHLARFSAALADNDLLAAYARGLAVERATITHWGTAAAEGHLQPYDILVLGRVNVPTGLDAWRINAERFASKLYPRGWHLRSVLWANEKVYDPASARVNVDQHRWNPSAGDPSVAIAALQASGRLEGLRLALAAIAILDFSRAEGRTIAAQAQVDLASTAIALEQHRRAHGAYPAQLSGLAPAVLAALPHDLTDGKPLRYRPTADGRFQLYALSFNRTDDGGSTMTDSAAPEISQDAQTLDWVWPQPSEPVTAMLR